MNKIAIGKYVTTHGIKGEIRIKSDFNEKDKVFKVGNEIIIDKPYIPYRSAWRNRGARCPRRLPFPGPKA